MDYNRKRVREEDITSDPSSQPSAVKKKTRSRKRQRQGENLVHISSESELSCITPAAEGHTGIAEQKRSGEDQAVTKCEPHEGGPPIKKARVIGSTEVLEDLHTLNDSASYVSDIQEYGSTAIGVFNKSDNSTPSVPVRSNSAPSSPSERQEPPAPKAAPHLILQNDFETTLMDVSSSASTTSQVGDAALQQASQLVVSHDNPSSSTGSEEMLGEEVSQSAASAENRDCEFWSLFIIGHWPPLWVATYNVVYAHT